jgi:serine/threonine-protein kinase
MRLVGQCLEKSPERRFQSARDVGLVLASELGDTDLARGSAAPSGSPRVRQLGIAAGCVLAGAILASAAWKFRGIESLPTQDAPSRLTIALPAALPFSYGPPMAISPDGTQVAVAMKTAEGHQLFLRRIDRDVLVPLPGTQEAQFPFFSSDGEWVGFWSQRKIRKVSTRGGTAIAVTDAADTPFRGADWSGGTILFAPRVMGPLFARRCG